MIRGSEHFSAPEQPQSTPETNEPMTELGDFERPTEGYIVIMPLPEDVKQSIAQIQSLLTDGGIAEQALWLPSGDQLHSTFAHIVSPDADYEDEKRANVFANLEEQTDEALEAIIPKARGDRLVFDELRVFPAAVILVGHDDGIIAQTRKDLTATVDLPDETRRPPDIIHVTIARFKRRIPLGTVKELLEGVTPHIETRVDSLQLIQEHAMYTQSHINNQGVLICLTRANTMN